MDNSFMATHDLSTKIDDIYGFGRTGAKFLDDGGIIAAGNKTDILAVRLLRYCEAEALGMPPDLRLADITQWKTQKLELFRCGGKQEIALVPIQIMGTVHFRSLIADHTAHIMSGRQGVRIEPARGGQQIAKFYGLVAGDTGDRRFAA